MTFINQLTEQERSLLYEKGVMKRYADGATIFSRGDEGSFMLIVQSGRIKIVLYSENGKEIILEIKETGDMLGEFALLDEGPRSANAIAEGDCTALFLTRKDLLSLTENYPSIGMKISTCLARQLRQNNDLIESVALLDLPTRLARLILRHMNRYGESIENGILIRDNLNQSDYGQLIAATRESVNKQIRQWQRDGWIELRKEGLCVLDKAVLQKLAEK